MSNPFGYSDAIWQRFNDTPAAGALVADQGEGRLCVARVRSKAADLELMLSLRSVDGRIVDARFLALGCPTTIAVGQWLCETLPGLGCEEARALRAPQLIAALEIADNRLHCALLGEDAVAAALKEV